MEYNLFEGNMASMNKHTSKTLAKYSGMDVFVANFHDGYVGSIEEIRNRSGSVGVLLKNGSFIWSNEDDEKHFP